MKREEKNEKLKNMYYEQQETGEELDILCAKYGIKPSSFKNYVKKLNIGNIDKQIDIEEKIDEVSSEEKSKESPRKKSKSKNKKKDKVLSEKAQIKQLKDRIKFLENIIAENFIQKTRNELEKIGITINS